jgi:N,N'-diacetyllegionaminate synthase
MVARIRDVELSLGDGSKIPTSEEKANIAISRQRIIAAKNIKKNTTLRLEDLTTSRSASGIFADKFWDVIGSVATSDFEAGEAIER